MAASDQWLSADFLLLKKTRLSSRSDSEYIYNPLKQNKNQVTTDTQSIHIRSNNNKINESAYSSEFVLSALNERSKREDLSGAFTSGEQLLSTEDAYAHFKELPTNQQNSTSITIQAAPNDDNYYKQWGLKNTTYGSKAEAAWDSGVTGSLANVIGVVDTGIDYKHPDLYLNIWLNPGEVPNGVIDINNDGLITFFDLNDSSNSAFAWDFDQAGDYGYGYVDAGDLFQNDIWIDGFDNENNGYIDDLIGWDFYNDDNDPFDDDSHGTHVAGTIGALSNNQTGVAGVNWDIQLTALKFLGPNGGYTSDAVRAVDYFTDVATRYDSLITNNGNARYLATNNSWGGGGFNSSLSSAIQAGADQGIIFVAAAGNDENNNDNISSYPSNYEAVHNSIDHVVAVASIDQNGSPSWFTNYGPDFNVDIAAPGGNIESTVPYNGYDSYWGTSMAAPHVSGALGLLASKNPTASSSELIQALYTGADQNINLLGTSVDGKLLNIASSLNELDGPDPNPTPTLSISAESPYQQFEGDQDTITNFIFTVTRQGDDLSKDSTVQWSIPGSSTTGEATADDFIATGGSLLFTNGESSKTITVEVKGDAVEELDETFSVLLSSPTNATIGTESASAVILNDDITPGPIETPLFTENFETGDYYNNWIQDSQNDWRISSARSIGNWAAEIDGRANNAWMELSDSLNITSFDDVRVDIQWLIETSFDNDEFLAIDASINDGDWIEIDRLSGANGTGGDEQSGNPFQEGSYLLGDLIADYSTANQRNLKIRLRGTASSSSEDAYFDDVIITGLNQNSGTPPPILSISAESPYQQFEGDQGANTNFIFTVTRQGDDLSNESTVQWSIPDGSTTGEATADDFIATGGSLLFTNGESSKTITVEVKGDAVEELDETFSVLLSSPTNATIGTESASAVILNDDIAPGPIETPLFTENFETGDYYNNWIQDSQNDWRISSARSIGNWAAEIDGRANNAWMELSDSLNITSFDDVRVDIQWLIETSFDNGEFLAIDASINDGDWIEIDRLSGARGTGGDEQSGNPFQDGSFFLGDLIADYSNAPNRNLKIRLRGTASSSREDAYFDDFVITGLTHSDSTNFAPTKNHNESYFLEPFELPPDPIA
ncbi:S8 family serine peptidase [Synechococcus sp. A15-44]|uniref:S8 family serine peptidase n=1 Tax=Synechococcus sp. A15-44 TaxID=1050646 RepID=UPI001644E484|nr:S8 family serine peptidase [Synechococcus sp. A15-44]